MIALRSSSWPRTTGGAGRTLWPCVLNHDVSGGNLFRMGSRRRPCWSNNVRRRHEETALNHRDGRGQVHGIHHCCRSADARERFRLVPRAAAGTAALTARRAALARLAADHERAPRHTHFAERAGWTKAVRAHVDAVRSALDAPLSRWRHGQFLRWPGFGLRGLPLSGFV